MSDSARNEDTSNDTQWRQAIVTEIEILLIYKEVSKFWRDLGTLLKLRAADVDNIEQDNSSNRDRAWNVMKRWLQRKGSDATLGILTDALEEIGMRSTVEKLVGTEKMTAGLKSVRAASGKLREDVELLKKEIQEEKRMHQETRKKLGQLNDIVHEMQTEMGEKDRQNMQARVQRLETTIKQPEKQEVPELTRLGEIERGLCVVQESIKIIAEYLKMAAGGSLESEKNALDEPNERRQEETKPTDPVQRDTIQREQENQRTDEVNIQPLLDESQKCSHCLGLEKELNDMKTEEKTLKIEISRLQGRHSEDKKKWDDENEERKQEIKQIKDKRDALQKEYDEQLKKIAKLEKKIEKIKTNKNLAMKEKDDQIKKLKSEKEELTKLQKDETDPEELRQLKKEKTEMSTKIEELCKRVNNSESECKRLQEKLDEYIKCRRRVISPTGKQFGHNCLGVICFLKRESAELRAYRSSDGPGNAVDIFDHRRGTSSGTAGFKDSWWSIDLGPGNKLVITNCSLRDGKMNGDSALINWQLKGSNDGKNWEEFENCNNMKDPQCKCDDRSVFRTSLWSFRGEMKPFRFFRIFQTGFNSSGKYGIFLSGIELYGVLLRSES